MENINLNLFPRHYSDSYSSLNCPIKNALSELTSFNVIDENDFISKPYIEVGVGNVKIVTPTETFHYKIVDLYTRKDYDYDMIGASYKSDNEVIRHIYLEQY